MTEQKKDVQRLIGRAILDPDFAQKCIDDPFGAAEDEGIALNEKEAKALMTLGEELKRIGEIFEKAKRNRINWIDVIGG
ncbi:MAG TPA: Os1348 family NHLP clan protein [archaeon]|nr:Os1348 family NHLP clan protein [archaeon]